ncbi:Hydantoinase/oxoprolinase [Syntrophomonas zehnderi OL-4]|uniref:Hydantoinase/oxoprolinase n=1 Tax=Syntrophomonas zehnderi OL-4 TaxID=690567 RepID=A0A0E4GDE7_9FIRM|nr:hydantoinase/oxoprolinase N-terminal domain-containing protein [Syntrophomonas zehnderi]CFX45595.1 Hydantoinase/oxoprolinase [Syntrophomonas zehnderi OL-4]
MLIGIDVGGTFTDGVLFDTQNSRLLNTVKVATCNEDLKSSLLQVLDQLLEGQDAPNIKRVVFSTTLVTNLLATGSAETLALLLIPGPGLPRSAYEIFPHTYFLKGSSDFRGRETEKLDRGEIEARLKDIHTQGISKIAVVGKFSIRNPQHEKEIQTIIAEQYPHIQVALGSETAGQLNFMRRIVTCYYTLMSQSAWENFVLEIEAALTKRHLQHAQIDILKADGGTMSLANSVKYPCETIFSGPAASTMGAMALADKGKTAVVLDIGGTTTDISLLLDGQPLYASCGAAINGHYSHISAFSTRSLPLGGDSPIVLTPDRQIAISPQRSDVAACFGGQGPTVIDVFNCKYNLGIGNPSQSEARLKSLSESSDLDMPGILVSAEEAVMDKLMTALQEMAQDWENEPAYRVWEIVHNRRFEIEEIVGIGAAAAVIVPKLAERMQVKALIHEYSPVANAIGAAIARPTLTLNLHVDTQNAYYTTDIDGIGGNLSMARTMQMEDAHNLARELLTQIAAGKEMDSYVEDAEVFRAEQFNIIRTWDTQGKIFTIGIQIKPGFIAEYKEGSL